MRNKLKNKIRIHHSQIINNNPLGTKPIQLKIIRMRMKTRMLKILIPFSLISNNNKEERFSYSGSYLCKK